MTLSDGSALEKTVLIACAGAQLGHGLGLAFARAGAKVICVDHDETLLMTLTRAAPDRIEPLRLNLMKPEHIGHFTDIWADTPLTFLILCQMLRFPGHPAMALPACAQLTSALAPALRSGGGQAVYLCQGGSADPVTASLSDAMGAFAARLQAQLGASVPINGVQVQCAEDRVDAAALQMTLAGLNAPGAARIGGTLMTVLPRSD